MTDEVKLLVKALRTRCADIGDCNECPKACYCFYGGDWKMRNDAADLLEFLYAEFEQVRQEQDGLSIMLTSATSAAETYKRERDAAVKDIPRCCSYCVKQNSCDRPAVYDDSVCDDFMWRGGNCKNACIDV